MKNFKLTSKKLLVVVLAVILFVTCISSSSFSWFTRRSTSYSDGLLTGGKLSLTLPAKEGDRTSGSDAELKAYDGSGVTMNTYLSTDDGVTFSDTAAAPAKSGTLGITSPSNRIYYKTEITNGSTTEQNVSLYIKDFAPSSGSGSNVCVGVNEPIKAFKNYSLMGVTIPSPTKGTANASTKRVYFCPVAKVKSGNAYDLHRSAWSNKTYYVKSGNNVDSSVDSSVAMTRCPSNTDYYYADIPWDHNQLYFSCAAVPANSQRTQTFTDVYGDGLSTTQSLMFYTNGDYTDYNNAWAGKEYCTGANVAKFYNNITISNVSGETVSVALADSDYQSNNGVSYGSFRKSGNSYVADTSIFTVNSNGVITPKAAGTGYLRYRTTSVYGDTCDVYVSVKVNTVNTSTATIKSAPIVTNLLIPAATTKNQVNTDKSNVQVVYWFIQNGDPLYGEATANGTYTLDSIYLGL